MTPAGRGPFDAFCGDAFAFLDGAGVRYLVIGGLAVIAVGEPRTTGDVDVVGYLGEAQAQALIERAKAAGFDTDPEIELERLKTTGTLRFRRGHFQLDIIVASLPFEEQAYARAVSTTLFGRSVLLPTPEDLLLFKVLAGRDKDLVDAVGIAKRHKDHLDWKYVEAIVRELCDLAEDLSAYRRLEQVKGKSSN